MSTMQKYPHRRLLSDHHHRVNTAEIEQAKPIIEGWMQGYYGVNIYNGDGDGALLTVYGKTRHEAADLARQMCRLLNDQK